MDLFANFYWDGSDSFGKELFGLSHSQVSIGFALRKVEFFDFDTVPRVVLLNQLFVPKELVFDAPFLR